MDKEKRATRMGKLLEKIESAKQDIKVNKPDLLAYNEQNKSLSLLSEEEISLVLAHRARKLRLQKNIKQNELSKDANLSSATTYSNFERTGKISLVNFIKVLRALGRLEQLDELLKLDLSDTIKNLDDLSLAAKKRAR